MNSPDSDHHGTPATPRLWGLRLLGIVAPVLLIVGLEFARLALESSHLWTPGVLEVWRVAFMAALIASVVAFALVMFRLIDRVQHGLITQNRDLMTAHAVSSAIQGQGGVQEIVEAATQALVATAGASGARIQLLPSGHGGARSASAIAGEAAGEPAAVLPLTNGDAKVGRLELWYPSTTGAADRVGPTTLETLGTQVAYAVQLAEAVHDLHRGMRQGHAFYDVLLKISNLTAAPATLGVIAEHARTLLGADSAALIVHADALDALRFEPGSDAYQRCSDGSHLITAGLPLQADPGSGECPNPVTVARWGAEASHDITGAGGALGSLWVGRRERDPFTGRDEGFLATLAELAAIALANAEMREDSRQAAVLSERTRIARETHDSHAQVLGAVHLRLRALEANPSVVASPKVAREIGSLADVCAEAYQDAREVILALRDSEKPRGTLDESIAAYLAKFQSYFGVATRFVNEIGPAVRLSPRAEVHLVRVVQEALTNVRKHAAASEATVTLSADEDGTTLVIADDGRGFSAPPTAERLEGYGLVTMRERVLLLGGTLTIESTPGAGTRVIATVPERPAKSLGSEVA